MIVKYAQGFNNKATVAPFPYEPTLEQPVEYDVEHDASGLGKAVGGGTARFNYSYLEKEEAQILLPFLGINSRVPSAACTLMVDDLFGIPLFYNGYVNLIMPRGGAAWWTDFGLEFSALEQI
jgi:hypothetical protein